MRGGETDHVTGSGGKEYFGTYKTAGKWPLEIRRRMLENNDKLDLKMWMGGCGLDSSG